MSSAEEREVAYIIVSSSIMQNYKQLESKELKDEFVVELQNINDKLMSFLDKYKDKYNTDGVKSKVRNLLSSISNDVSSKVLFLPYFALHLFINPLQKQKDKLSVELRGLLDEMYKPTWNLIHKMYDYYGEDFCIDSEVYTWQY